MDASDVVRVASGSLVEVELWQGALTEAGVTSRVVGTELSAGFGSALPGSIELWVSREDLDKAEAAIRYAAVHPPGEEPKPAAHEKPVSDHIPDPPNVRRPHTNPNPY